MARSDVMGLYGWEDLPRHLILMILSHLSPGDRLTASLAYNLWGGCLRSPLLWRNFTFRFATPEEELPKSLGYLDIYGGHARNIRIELDPRESSNCTNASRVLTHLARSKERSLEELTIRFTKGNPLFFRGSDILCSLVESFGPPDPQIHFRSFLRVLDLDGMNIASDDEFLYLLAGNHSHIHGCSV